MDLKKIGLNIATLRKKKKLTQQELGDKLFVTDKAVSKWERGICLPDIAILEKLAEILDTDIYELLQIENKRNVKIEKILEEERVKIKKQLNRRNIIIAIPITLIVLITLFKLLPFGYNVIPVEYNKGDEEISLGVPKFSFLMKYNENSYSFKSLRGSNVLKSEMKNYVNKLEHITCKNTAYYYDKESNITIVDYQVENHFLYNTITYDVRYGNYCNMLKINEYGKKLGKLLAFFHYENEDEKIHVAFLPGISVDSNVFEGRMQVYVRDEGDYYAIERSTGTYEINDNVLTYYRKNIEVKGDNINIPVVSNFIIDNKKLILEENYLSSYIDGIILE